MQKVIRRTALAKAQHARKAQRRSERLAWEARKAKLGEDRERSRLVYKDIKQARITRREDWELGPLAPLRNVGSAKETYGAMEVKRIRPTEVLQDERIKFWNIVEDDRVVVLEGRDKGKIGAVKSLEKKSNTVTVEGLNMVDVQIPPFMLTNEPDKRPVRSVEMPLPLSSVRLVHALTDPDTGITRDVIVKKIVNSRIWFDKHNGVRRWTRLIPGLNVKIPWPKKEPREYKVYEIDTLRASMETRTWVPTLLTPPMPETVIDELRNKYSIFRSRHDEEYIARKVMEDEENERKKRSVEMMRTPLKEANKRARRERKKLGKGTLSREMLVRIGEVMARKRGLLAAAAAPPPPPPPPVTIIQ
ncbi:hypothetical protein FGG08_007011 [Glutinoglossum americanum]|uniref:KOW domain-containing protein n=1 Tax=Glutinoglossum americanum TaxID=1670608 RepID=A0A9P8HV43_9PEZI|nr:hypothetical protein FGG08_007011 [Glutinoglossum americanum]